MTRIAEGKTLELRVETFNTLNHFNPSNPNTSLTYNFTTGAQTNAELRHHQGAQIDPRRAVLSAQIQVLRQALPDGRGSDRPRPFGNFWYCYKEWECEYYRLWLLWPRAAY